MKGKVFTAQEVQVMLNGSKVVFREVIKPQNILIDASRHGSFQIENGILKTYHRLGGVWHLTDKLKCPYQVGQKIFCKESFIKAAPLNEFGNPDIFNEKVWFKATDEKPEHLIDNYDWVSATSMEQEHSRLTLIIKEIMVERLADISEEDARKGGIPNAAYAICGKTSFAKLWNANHKKPEEKFEASPFVWVVPCEVVKC